MAYVIPVAVLALDHAAAAAAIGEPADYFDNDRNDRWDGLERLERLTGAPVSSFSSEDESVYDVGLQIESNFRIDINAALATKAQALKAQYPHPLIQSAQLAVVSTFC